MKRFIYADNAATTQLDKDAFEEMKPYLLNEYGNASQPYSFARNPRKALNKARQTIADCINAEPEEIYFTSGGTESDNLAIKGSAFADAKKRATVTTAIEHHAVLNAARSIEHMGYPVAYAFPNKNGEIEPHVIESLITSDTRLVSVMMSNNELGTIQPIKSLTRIAHSYGALFHTDAVQCIGHIPVDVKELKVDMLSASAHKFNGPKGVGFLYIRKGVAISPLLCGGSQENGMRGGTENVAGIVGMACALKKNCDYMLENTKHLHLLESNLLSEFSKYGIKYLRNGGKNCIPGTLSLSFPGYDGEAILHRLDLMGIQISTGSACNSERTQISHVLSAIQLDETVAKGTVRVSFGKDNTMEDVITIASAIQKIVR